MDHLTGYEAWLAQEKRVAVNTLSSYLRDVRQFADWAGQEHLDITQMSQDDIRFYAQHLERKGKSNATIVRSVAALKSFYTYLISIRAVQINPAKGFSPCRAERKLPAILSNHEVDLFLEQPDPSDSKGCRDKAMLELLYATGIRVSELISLDVQDLNLSASFLRCRGRSKERVVPLYKGAVRAMAAYINDVRPQLLENPGETV